MSDLGKPNELPGARAARGAPGGFSGRVHAIKDADLVWQLLADPENDLSLSHYDNLMFDLKQPIALLLGEDQCQSIAWKVFGQALSLDNKPVDRKGEVTGFDAPISRNNTDLIAKLAKLHSANVVKKLKTSSAPKTNIIREYGYYIPYLVGLEFTGLSESVKISNSLRLFTFTRNLKQMNWGKGRMKLSGSHGAANAYLLWTHFLLGQAFSNFGNRTTPIETVKHRLAGWGSQKYFDQIQASLDRLGDTNVTKPAPFNLSQRLLRLEQASPEALWGIPRKERDYIYKCILFEIMMSFHILIGISFAKTLDAIIESGETVYEFADKLRQSDNPDRILNIYMSKDSPTAEIYRISRRAFPELGIKMGDILKLDIKEASKNLPSDTEKFLNFGPHESCPYDLSANGERTYSDGLPKNEVSHPCYGQFWARTVLKEMFFQLTDETTGFKNLSLPKTKTKDFAFIPDHLMVTFMGES